jgi:hypothetical protein
MSSQRRYSQRYTCAFGRPAPIATPQFTFNGSKIAYTLGEELVEPAMISIVFSDTTWF